MISSLFLPKYSVKILSAASFEDPHPNAVGLGHRQQCHFRLEERKRPVLVRDRHPPAWPSRMASGVHFESLLAVVHARAKFGDDLTWPSPVGCIQVPEPASSDFHRPSGRDWIRGYRWRD
ncbi:hypothetical protein MPNT_20086 [Candidatus Methylacidithermus pantelleriae]|uniref:Uncharacterized protein n=1 Tax=Candidatus Methylacidithermus pantelleriae TaxID=2744239 RepID=A0A8J2BJ46_9BACT|nr:hypothetical protein MPNT_20086 [Candidatus Methylacidithermus pantelleriae]